MDRGGKAHLVPISQHLNSGEIQIGNRIMRRHGVNAPTQVCAMATWSVTSLGTEGSPLLPVKDSNTGRWRRGQGGVRQDLQSEGRKNMLWEEQTTPLSCGVGCPVKAEIDEAKKR